MREKSRYYAVTNKYLAYGLAFCGFKFYVYDNGKTYKFEDSVELREAVDKIVKVRKEFNKFER
ncbi:hypothetical protein [Clostridium perfringens]|uniref:hypothetical protein n=1 Tax=Clostridium perfringens TaxID=1502 RepID=UPI000F534CCF|nr:hypothetical protein [Clostridium perfringens]MDM0592521.1 hypothetical protein [Clostridium perfringens]MDM0595521.1 hypothetical protein [Clostridium perfringens]MDU5493697.1 hypothetical protein [Clostridium perfringens]MDU6896376.1 hypothetical protein [Clostridium perfringens]MDU6933544.1 hypothetical protein [Clostridium perfringens]